MEQASGLRIFLLGGFRAYGDGEEKPSGVSWRRPTAQQLVKLLACVPAHRLHQEQVIEALWPTLDPDAGFAAFRKALSLARHALEPELRPREQSRFLVMTSGGLLELAGQAGRSGTNTVWIDADCFERLARSALRKRETEALEAALSAYSGELLPEDCYEDWTARRREELAELNLQVMVALADDRERARRYGDAIEVLQAARDVDPTQESLCRHLMRLHMLNGSRHLALRAYHHCRETVQRELGVDPESATETSYREVLDGLIPGDEPTLGQAPAIITMASPSPVPFVGRGRLLRDLQAMLMTPPDRESVVLLSGEAGVGKTRMATEAVRALLTASTTVLWGTARAQEGQVAYGPLAEAFRDYLETCTPDRRGRIISVYPKLAPILPSPRNPRPHSFTSTGSDASSERRSMVASIVRLLADIARDDPVQPDSPMHSNGRGLLVLDDLQAADPATIEVMRSLLPMLRGSSFRVLGTYRTEDVRPDTPFHALLADARAAGLCSELALGPLIRPDCDALVQRLLRNAMPGPPASVEPGVSDTIYARSLGFPLFVVELIRTMRETGDLALERDGSPRGGRWVLLAGSPSVPSEIQHLVERRIDGIPDASAQLDAPVQPEHVRHVLEIAAVLGAEFSFLELAHAAALSLNLPEPAVLQILDRALELYLLEERVSGYAFRHPLFRGALYENLSEHRRARLHHAALEACERYRPDDVEVLAFHAASTDLLGGSRDQERARRYLEQAGDRARDRHAPEVALTWYQDLLARLESTGHRRDIARVREKLGMILKALARYDESIETLELAAAMYDSVRDEDGAARVATQIGRVYGLKGAPDDGITRLSSRPQRIDSGVTDSTSAQVQVTLAHLHFAAGRYQEQLDAAERGAELALAAGATGLLAETQVRCGTALCLLGRLDLGRTALEEAIPLAEQCNDLDTLQRALNGVGAAAMIAGRLRESRDFRERALAAAERQGDPVRIASALTLLAQSTCLLGDRLEARRCLQRAVDLIQSLGPSWTAAYPWIHFGGLFALEGKWTEAREYLEQAIAIAERSGDLQVLRGAHAQLAEMDLLTGGATRAAAAIARLEPLLDRPGSEEWQVNGLLMLLAWARMEMGDSRAANVLAARGLERINAQNDRLAEVEAQWIWGSVLAQQHRWLEAEEAFQRSAALAQSMPHPCAEAAAQYGLGALHLARHAPERAQGCFAQALVIFKRVGAQWWVERTEAALAGIAGNSRSGTQTPPTARRVAPTSAAAALPAGVTATLSDDRWAQISRVLRPPDQPGAPVHSAPNGRSGRPRADDRRTLEGILYVLANNCRWQDLPAEYGSPVTAWRRLRRWQAEGIWPGICQALAPDVPDAGP